MKDKKIFIAGAGGYLGSKLTENLLSTGYKVVAMDRYFFGDNLADLKSNPNLTIIKDDIRYFDKKYLKNVEIVINLASLSNDPSAELNLKFTRQINYLGAKRLAKLAKKMKVRKYIFASSCSVYGTGDGELDEKSKLSPVSEYARSKILAEKSLKEISDKNFNVTSLRLSTLFGVSERRMRFDLMVNVMTLYAWKNNKIFVLGGGKQWRPLLHILDAINAIEKVMDRNLNESYEVFNIGANDQNFQTIQVANEFKKYFPGLEIEIAPSDPDPRDYKVRFDKARKELNFKPKISINDGIIEIKEALEKAVITDGLKTSTHNYYKYLIEADDVLNFVKLKKKLL